MLIRLAAALLLLVLWATPALAQTGRLYYRDDGQRLDRAKVAAAAQPLLNRGAYVAIYAVDSGQGTEFLSALQDDGLRNGDTVNPNLIAIFVSYDDRYSEIRYGDRWVAALGNVAGSIQDNTLNPSLAAGDSTAAFTNTLAALDRAAAGQGSGGVTAPGAGSQADGGSPWAWVLGLLALIGIPVGWSSLSKRQAAAKLLSAARKELEDARLKAGAGIADTGRLLKDSQEKAQYDKLSYPAEEAERLAAQQSAAEQELERAQEAFTAAEDAVSRLAKPGEAELKASAATYLQVAGMAEQARALLAQVEARRAELDKLAEAAPGKVEDAKKALADVAERLGVLGEGVQHELITRPIGVLIGRAEGLLAENRAADAIQASEAASATAAELGQSVARFADLREGISAGRAAAEKAAAQGFRVEDGLSALDTSEGLIAQAARALEQGGPQAAAPLLDQAEAARAEGVAGGGALPALHEANLERIAALRQEHAAVAAHIDAGRTAFDLVDEFAESTWSDIRGNGSESEAALAVAGERIERAAAGSTMEAQLFREAAADLEVAGERLTFARTLIDTILQRLKDLEAARGAARAEIGAAQQDIEQGWAFVRSNDPDVGKVPEQALQQAAELVRQAEVEIKRDRPNWLEIVRLAQQANGRADEALALARGELEVANKLREQLQRAQQVAVGEVQKLTQFAGVHEHDLTPDSRRLVGSLQNDIQLASNAAEAVAQREEEARTLALRDAIGQYSALQQRAEQVFQELQKDFQAAEERRRRVAAEVREAEQAIERADQARREGGGMISAGSQGFRLLEQARVTLDSIDPVANERDMQQAIRSADEAASAARQAESLFRAEIDRFRREQQSSAQDVLTGMVIGSLLNDNRGSRGGGSRGGGSWGGGGSSGGGSWGRGGSSGGGSWGGGGSSGGKGW